jgi:hypothetical protein
MNSISSALTATANPTLPQQVARMDLDRIKAYRENLDFYNGLQWQGHSRMRERRLTFNYAKVFVDKVTSYLMSGLDFAIDPASPGDRDKSRRAEEALYKVYDTNNLDQLDFDTEIDATILGDGCYKVTWDPREKRVRVSAPDVQGVYVWWLGDDINRIWRVASRYRLSADEISLLYGVKSRNTRKESTVVEVWTEKSPRWSRSGLRGSSSYGSTTSFSTERPIRTDSYLSLYIRICVSLNISGEYPISRLSWSRPESLTGRYPSFL